MNNFFTNCTRCCLIIMMAACRKEAPVIANTTPGLLIAVNTLRSIGCVCGDTWMPPVKALEWNDTLAAAALLHARDMEANSYFSHISPGGSSPIQRAIITGYTGHFVTENIAKGFTSPEMVMEAWQQSESHCKAMMDGSHTDMGAARANSHWVQEFGSH
ncbi:CAP domain-containing protein [Longitalea arenae]|uniref:CAP domain-containing protein n=1 Tax=Longitalea arenae TaxID=2812558 RepID=UPI0019688D3E|nr:CAP domain-containing protein [Longitalea arenae]